MEAAEELAVSVIVHEIVLAALIENEVEGAGIAAVHGDDEHYAPVVEHGGVKCVNIVVAVFAPTGKTFIGAVGAGVIVKLPEMHDTVPGRGDIFGDGAAVAAASGRKADDKIHRAPPDGC